ncbi:bifunctional diaminohydroxyphosphoribosylaminopyrimidine deaminase/5-amino-6-(5-phosphoribosylamino)uracil reductase RibD [Thiotrichales bacterium 19S3-7]|nr:bifunctional diaminohydroxyphosphoribosylaminopyrimidine deaminase/5-amino-6-(5-phosphoribosylamino)uracil reductase RibD [Thiotrichales bacterium 19S3-7]MCF6800872.1 bifunctional diaminohydroxyphosphoribosylaminopyrimidine deaminase/5-amino-6-(5-phosphoribosylamino)uracil reductase RibD [Thiotrichales bacterium 19S3-11]
MSLERISAFDQWMMQKAIALAEKGIYTVRINPAVGCILVKDQRIIGQGYHQKAGMPHAEINALADCKRSALDPKGATAYVTLEPCSHYGKTPPCVDALIEAGIKEVIIASKDPNPKVNGIDKLKKAGIKVIDNCLAAQAERLNLGFFKSMRMRLPYVRLKLAASLDARTAMASGESKWITSEKSRYDVQKLRARSGAIITGVATVLADNPRLTVREKINSDFPIEQPLRVIIDRNLTISMNANVIDASGKSLIVTQSTNYHKIQVLEERGIQILQLKFDDELLKNTLSYLNQTLLIHDVLIESGHRLAGSFLRADLIDEFCYYMAPCIMGKTAKPLFDVAFDQMKEKYQFKLESVTPLGDDIKMIYTKQLKDEHLCG